MVQRAAAGRIQYSRTALVVDDSRVALMSLARLLKAQGLVVDMVESGPEALNYLRLNPPPAAIFLDHMMPGMDGFDTLRAIKASAATSLIPIVMYTSKEGDAYLNEARTRGAAEVLQKPAHAVAVDRILKALQIPHFPEGVPTQPTTAPRPVETTVPIDPSPPRASVAVTHASLPIYAPPRVAVERASVHGTSGMKFSTVILLFVLAAVAGWWSYMQYQELEQARDQLLSVNARLKALESRPTEIDKIEPAQVATETPRSSEPNRSLLDTLVWAINQQSRYDFGEIPFNDARLQLLRELVSRLNEAGFRGAVRLEGHLGEFCIVRDEQGGNRLPPPGTLFSGCEVLTFPPGEALRLAQRQSDAFMRFVNEQGGARGPIEVVVVSHGATRPLQRYPDHATTASEWNAAARVNQRVEISLVPVPR
jgi:CheY-like chemotaxis protein